MTLTKISRRNLLFKSAAAMAASPLVVNKSFAFNSESSARMDDSIRDKLRSWYQNITDTGWLKGGTSSMIAPFPPCYDPFKSGLGNTCMPITESIVGPCYFDNVITESDISDGQPGIPMTLVLKLVDANCQPIQGGQVEVWWVNTEGVYSANNEGSTNGAAPGNPTEGGIPDESELEDSPLAPGSEEIPPFFPEACVPGDVAQSEQVYESKWFRGLQTSDAGGNVFFKACFPGWYTGRSQHIHVRVVAGGGEQSLVTQLTFDDQNSREIYLNHPDYTGEEQDTPLDQDFLFSTDVEECLFEIDRQFDGSMLAYKAIQLH